MRHAPERSPPRPARAPLARAAGHGDLARADCALRDGAGHPERLRGAGADGAGPRRAGAGPRERARPGDRRLAARARDARALGTPRARRSRRVPPRGGPRGRGAAVVDRDRALHARGRPAPRHARRGRRLPGRHPEPRGGAPLRGADRRRARPRERRRDVGVRAAGPDRPRGRREARADRRDLGRGDRSRRRGGSARRPRVDPHGRGLLRTHRRAHARAGAVGGAQGERLVPGAHAGRPRRRPVPRSHPRGPRVHRRLRPRAPDRLDGGRRRPDRRGGRAGPPPDVAPRRRRRRRAHAERRDRLPARPPHLPRDRVRGGRGAGARVRRGDRRHPPAHRGGGAARGRAPILRPAPRGPPGGGRAEPGGRGLGAPRGGGLEPREGRVPGDARPRAAEPALADRDRAPPHPAARDRLEPRARDRHAPGRAPGAARRRPARRLAHHPREGPAAPRADRALPPPSRARSRWRARCSRSGATTSRSRSPRGSWCARTRCGSRRSSRTCSPTPRGTRRRAATSRSPARASPTGSRSR